MMPPLSATPSAPTITKSTFSIINLCTQSHHNLHTNMIITQDSWGGGNWIMRAAKMPFLPPVLNHNYKGTELHWAYPTAESRINFDWILDSSNHLCMISLWCVALCVSNSTVARYSTRHWNTWYYTLILVNHWRNTATLIAALVDMILYTSECMHLPWSIWSTCCDENLKSFATLSSFL